MHSAQTGAVLNALSLTSRETLVRTGALNLTAQLFPRCTVFPPSLKFDRVAIYSCTLSSVFHFLPFSPFPSLFLITFSVQSNSSSVRHPFLFFPSSSHCPETYSFIKCVTVLLSLPQTLQTFFLPLSSVSLRSLLPSR